MTAEQAQADYDAARLKWGDACMADPPDQTAWEHAKEVLNQAEKVLRGFPRTLAGVRRTA